MIPDSHYLAMTKAADYCASPNNFNDELLNWSRKDHSTCVPAASFIDSQNEIRSNSDKFLSQRNSERLDVNNCSGDSQNHQSTTGDNQSHNVKRSTIKQTGTKPYQCQFCSKNFSRKTIFLAHKRVHTGGKPYQCNICAKAFVYSSSFEAHQKIHAGQNQKPYQCTICAKTFADETCLQIHKKTHAGENPYKCQFCSKLFCTIIARQKHERVHTGEKPFQCKICGKAFADKYTCQTTHYQREHTVQQLYQCIICRKTFANQQLCQIHEKIHFEKKICNETLKYYLRKISSKTVADNQSSAGQQHKIVRIRKKLFECQICGQAFARRYSCQVHEDTHAVGKIHKCTICSKTFADEIVCQIHQMVQHPEEKIRKN